MLIDLSSCLAQKLVKREGEVFCLTILNEVESRIKLPNPTITDVRDEENWIYVDPDEEGEDTDAEIEHQTRLSPPRSHAPHPHMSGAPPAHAPHTLERLSVKNFRKTLTKSVFSQHPWSPEYECKFRYLLCHSLKLLFHSNPQVVHLASQTPSKNHTLSRLVDEYKRKNVYK